MNSTMVLSYDGRGDPRAITEVRSHCIDVVCGGVPPNDFIEHQIHEINATENTRTQSKSEFAQVG